MQPLERPFVLGAATAYVVAVAGCGATSQPGALDAAATPGTCAPYGHPHAPFEVIVIGPEGASGATARTGYLFYADGRPRVLFDADGASSARLAELGVSREGLEILPAPRGELERAGDPDAKRNVTLPDGSDLVVTALPLDPAGASVAYRVDRGGVAVIIVTDLPSDAEGLVELDGTPTS